MCRAPAWATSSPWDAFAGVWAHWDGSWYLRIAEHGYWYWDYSEAFFPLYPLAMALLSSLVSIAPFMAGIIISNVSYAVALIFLYKLIDDRYGATPPPPGARSSPSPSQPRSTASLSTVRGPSWP